MAIAGKVAITPKGNWSASTAYQKLDLVYYNNGSYVSIQPSTGITPTNTAYWMLVLQSENKADIQSIINGETKVGDADKLDGHNSSYFAKDSDLAIERERISNLARLNEGSTTGDAELIDIRIGADGTVYETAGEAVRGQAVKLENELSHINSDIDIITERWRIEITGFTLYNGYLNTSGELVSGSSWRTSDFINIEGIEALIIDYSGTNTDYVTTNLPRKICQYDANKNFISELPIGTTVTDFSENAKYVRINFFLIDSLHIFGEGSLSPKGFSDLETRITTLEDTNINMFYVDNKIQLSTVIDNCFIRNNGEVVSTAVDFYTVKVPVEPNTSYKVYFVGARFYNFFNGETHISGTDFGDGTLMNGVYTTPSDCDCLAISGYYYGTSTHLDTAYVGFNEFKYDSLSTDIKVDFRNMPLDYIDTTNIRNACITFVFDDGITQDSEIYKAFVEYGFACGFAIPTSIAESDYERYKEYYNKGFSILSHSTDANGFSDTTQTTSQAVEKFRQSRRTLESKGFKISGWVTPSSQMNDVYIPTLERFYSYGYTQYYNDDTETSPAHNTLSDRPCNLKRRYLGTSLEALQAACNDAIDNEGFLTFYYHSRDLGTDLTIDTLKELLQWLAVHVRDYNCEVLPPDLAVRYYYRKRITD